MPGSSATANTRPCFLGARITAASPRSQRFFPRAPGPREEGRPLGQCERGAASRRPAAPNPPPPILRRGSPPLPGPQPQVLQTLTPSFSVLAPLPAPTRKSIGEDVGKWVELPASRGLQSPGPLGGVRHKSLLVSLVPVEHRTCCFATTHYPYSAPWASVKFKV